jgi:hypothetical protein
VRPLFEKNYVVAVLVTQEAKDKKALENEGADKLLATWGGARSGFPFFVFLDDRGKKLADSNVLGEKKSNIGCPASPEEIAAFGELMKQTAPRLSETERQQILNHFTKAAPKR